MSNENSLLYINLDSEAAKVFIAANEKGFVPEFRVITREDEALKVLDHYERVSFDKKVALTSVFEYVSKRKFETDPKENEAIVVYCVHPDRTRLDFQTYENTGRPSTTIRSSLTVNPDFKAFRVNSETFFTMDQLVELARTKGHCFAMIQDVKDFLKGLRNFEVKFTMNVEKADDRQGNTRDLIQTAIDRNKLEIPKTLRVKLPLFVAGPEVELELELEIQRGKNNMPEFGFYNIEAEILLRNQASKLVNEQVEKFRPNFVCLEVE